MCGTAKGLGKTSYVTASRREENVCCYFVVVIKHHNEKQVLEGRVYFGLQLQRVRGHNHRKTVVNWSEKLGVDILISKPKAERANRK